jgi:hypothetical protein
MAAPSRSRYGFVIVTPSCATSMVSTATSLPSAFRSVPVIFVGQALASGQTSEPPSRWKLARLADRSQNAAEAVLHRAALGGAGS